MRCDCSALPASNATHQLNAITGKRRLPLATLSHQGGAITEAKSPRQRQPNLLDPVRDSPERQDWSAQDSRSVERDVGRPNAYRPVLDSFPTCAVPEGLEDMCADAMSPLGSSRHHATS